MNKNQKGCFGAIGLVFVLGIIMWAINNIIGIAGLALAGWGIYSFFQKKRENLPSTIPVVIIVCGLIIGIGWFSLSYSSDETSRVELTQNEVESTTAIETENNEEKKEGSIDSEVNEDNLIESNEIDENHIPAKVVRVVDGDTIKVDINGEEATVRMILVDTPETKHPDKPVQPFGQEATDFAVETLEGEDVALELDVSERDRYGRILAYVWIGDKMFNEMLLERGLARVAVFPPDIKYVDQFREIQSKAQEEEIGIWSIENYVHDNGFEEPTEEEIPDNDTVETITEGCENPKIKGNRNSMIYHIPGGASYNRTTANVVYFCTEEEAQEAGYRKAQR